MRGEHRQPAALQSNGHGDAAHASPVQQRVMRTDSDGRQRVMRTDSAGRASDTPTSYTCNDGSSPTVDVAAVARAKIMGRRASPPAVKKTGLYSELAQVLAEEIGLEEPPDPGELSPADVSELRLVGKTPAENRLWNTADKPSASTAADILRRLPEYSRFDERTLRIFCHACQWRQFKRYQVMGAQASDQHEFFVVIVGTVVGYANSIVHAKAKVRPEKEENAHNGGADQPRSLRRSHSMSDMTQHGEEVSRHYSGSGVGINALLVGWNQWSMTYVAHTKVEVLSVPRFALENIERSLKWSFDSRSLVNVLKELKAAVNKKVSPKKADHGAHGSHHHHRNVQGEAEDRSEEWVTKISAAMQEVPYFRQLPIKSLQALAHSAEILEFDTRQVLWQQSQGTSPTADVEKSDEKQEDPAGVLHVILEGQVWAFKKDGAVSKDRLPIKMEDLWREPDRLFERYGSCVQTLVECDSMGAPSQLTYEYTMVVDSGTVLVRFRNPKHAETVNNCGVLYQYGSLHRLLRMSDAERSQLQKERLLAMVVQNLSFFNHIAKWQIAQLLEHITVERLLPGDTLIKQGEEVDCLYIILSGHATSYECPRIDVTTLDMLWSKWEIIRATGKYEDLGAKQQRLGTGDSVGESEVVETAPSHTTVVADGELEAIRISASTYTSVMWDLCDGEPVEVDLIREILSKPPHERTNEEFDCLMDMLKDSDFLQLFRGSDLLRAMTDAMTFVDCSAGHEITKQDSIGDTLFLVMSGSVALHSYTSGSEHHHSHHTRSRGIKVGPCRRVLGVGDSFGELAFVQGRPHPTSAIARSDSMLITLRRSNMSPQSVSRMLSLIEKPYGETMDSVFDKDISDRNEKDILLLVNYLEINPFLKQLAYPALIACARTALRHKLMAGEPLCTDLVSDKISETSVYIVNAGSVQVTPDIRGAAVAEQLQNLSSPSQTFADKTAMVRRSKESFDQQPLLFSGQLFVGAVKSQGAQLRESNESPKLAGAMAPLRRRVRTRMQLSMLLCMPCSYDNFMCAYGFV